MGKVPGSGRKRGTRNKKRQALHDKATELGCDPFSILLMVAKGDWKGLGYKTGSFKLKDRYGRIYEIERISLDQRLKAACEATHYLYPKQRSIAATITRKGEARPLAEKTDAELEAIFLDSEDCD